ncbi:hypothetical protein DUI87_15768 [Hirundo rustica rustica]|uniref:Endonuclease/exonuclease/phosphatase domain-containing protein n=1 Tax=Hirundo rustica rustica TaxID=333673 RepID=A0A3M0KGT3_HIRRU|nr:hypothetical protein DUI87_15768 [Hirundo rustica rustica]
MEEQNSWAQVIPEVPGKADDNFPPQVTETTRRAALLDLVLRNAKWLLGNVKGILGCSLVCSDHEAVEFKILRDVRRDNKQSHSPVHQEGRLWDKVLQGRENWFYVASTHEDEKFAASFEEVSSTRATACQITDSGNPQDTTCLNHVY